MSTAIPTPGETFRGEDGTVSTILPDFCDPNYEPPKDELDEYAACIGIDPDKEPELMWIALEGLRAPLPTGWRACETEVDDEDGDGDKKEVYYFNFETGDSLWDHPMDEVFREKVKAERAKLQKSGGGGGAAVGGLQGAAATAESKRISQGATKNIAAALFAGGTANSANNNNNNNSRLGSLSLMDSGVGAGRGMPDVSDVLASPNTSAFGGSSVLGGFRPFGQTGQPGSPAGGSASSASRGPVTMKDIEANLRKRIEDEFAPKEREEELRRDREVIETRSQLDRELTALKQQLDRAWEADNNKTDAERTAEIDGEAKKIEEGWTQRLADERKRVSELEAQIQAKQDAIKALKEQSVDVLKQKLAEANEAEVKARRETLMREVDEELTKKERERAGILDELRQKGSQSVATARTRLEADHKKQQEVKATYTAKLRAGAEEEVTRLEKELAEQEKRLTEAQGRASAPKASAPTTSTTAAAASSGMSIEALTAALAAVEEETRALETQHKDKLAKIKVEFTVKQDTVRSQIKRKEKEALEQSNNSFNSSTLPSPSASSAVRERSVSAAATEPSTPALSTTDQERLKDVESALKREIEQAKSKYEAETASLIAKSAASSSSSAKASPSLSRDTSSIVGSPKDAAPASDFNDSENSGPSPQEQRAKDAENTRHILSLKQLETKHEQVVRQIRERHHKALATAKRVDPRTAASYAKEMTTRKRAWLTANPQPQADLPKLEPVPKLMSIMGDVPAVEPPTEAEQQAYFQERLAEMKEMLATEEDAAKEAMAAQKSTELDALGNTYRTEQLEAANARVAKYRDELDAPLKAAAAREKASTIATKSSPAGFSAASSAVSAEELATLKALEDEAASLRKELESTRASATEAKSQHEKDTASLRTRISAADKQREASEAAARESRTAVPAASAPASLTKRQSSAVAFVPDFDTYIANDAATAEEKALRDKYQTELARLKAVASQEMELYEAAVRELAQARERQQQQQQQQQQQLPPPAPISASTPVNRSTMVAEAGGTHAFPPYAHDHSMYPSNPASSQPRYANPAAAAVAAMGGTPVFNGSQMGNGSLNASSIHPGSVAPFYSPHHQRVPEFLDDDDGAEGDDDVRRRPIGTMMMSMPRPTAASEPNPVPPAPAEHSATMSPTGAIAEGLFPRDEAYEHRLRSVTLALRARRSSLRDRQARLEGLRDEWRADMAACRAAKDRSQARVLKQVKLTLEDQARALNDAVLETKKAGQQLKQEKQRYEAFVAGGPAGVERYDVLAMLEHVANKTAALEQALLDPRRETRTTSRERSRIRAASSSARLQQGDQVTSRHVSARSASASASGGRALHPASTSAAPPQTAETKRPATRDRQRAQVEAWLQDSY